MHSTLSLTSHPQDTTHAARGPSLSHCHCSFAPARSCAPHSCSSTQRCHHVRRCCVRMLLALSRRFPSLPCPSYFCALTRGRFEFRVGAALPRRIAGRPRSVLMFSDSLPNRRFSHAFLDCLRDTGTTATDTRTADGDEQRERFALIVVNGEVGDFLPQLWRHASYRLCADGGVNRVYHALPPPLRSAVLPDSIVGDLDSASSEVLQYYRGLGVEVVREAEQLSTDLHKAIRRLARLLSGGREVRHVVVYGAFGGRFDQLVGNLVTLHSHQRVLPADVQLLLLSEGNLAQLLPAGRNIIAGHPDFEGAGKHCGLMALQGEVKGVWTSGLTWDIHGDSMGWDATMSTSNIVHSSDAQVAVSIEHGQLVWTTEFSRSTHSDPQSRQAES